MATARKLNRQKISTTVAPETLGYLQKTIASGEAVTLAEAIDAAVHRLLVIENRERLERDTAAYFENLTEEEDAEERALENALAQSAKGIDVDR